MKPYIHLLLLAVGTASKGEAGEFIDLDFERVRQPITVVGGTPTSEAFPGWTAFLGDVPQAVCLYNNQTTGAAAIALFSTVPPGGGFVISGRYTASLQPGVFQGARVSASLAQTGTIPVGSRTLLFNGGASGSLTVSIGGSLAPVLDLDHPVPPLLFAIDTYGVDVSAWAGKEVELKFTSLASSGGLVLDDIRFSPVALVPEPSTWALLGVGGVLLLWAAKRPPAT